MASSRAGIRGRTLCISIVLAWALCLGPIALPPAHAQPDEDPLTAEQRAWLEEHGPIRYAYEATYAPFEFHDRNGQAVGINFDLLDYMSRHLDIEFEKVQQPNFTAMLDAVRAGEADVIGTINPTPERDEFMDFSQAYAQASAAFFISDRHPEARSLEDLEGLEVGIIQDYNSGTWLQENHPELELTEVDDLEQALSMLNVGELDAVFEDTSAAGYLIRQNSYTNIRILDAGTFLETPSTWAVAEDEPVLLSIMNAGVASIPPGEQTKIFEYWTGQDLRPPSSGPTGISPLARNLLIATGGGAFLIAAWVGILRRQVRARTASLEESRAFLRTILDTNPDLVYTTDEAGHVTQLNQATATFLGREVQDLIGEPAHALGLPSPASDEIPPEGHVFETTLEQDGSVRDHQVAQALFEAGGARYILTVASDITERKRGEQALSAHATELRQRNEQLAQFAHATSHDLQEPVRMVALYAQLLERRYKGQLDETADEYISYAVEGAQRISRMVKAIRRYASLEYAGELADDVDLEAVVDGVVDDLSQVLKEKGGTVTCGPLPMARGDPAQLGQVLQNLVTNGLKFSSKARAPRVHIWAQPLDGQVAISVADNGHGIPADHQDKVFELFRRLDRSDGVPGTGIGLSICHRIIERHGGKLWVRSQGHASSDAPEGADEIADPPFDEGCTFTFTLTPAAPRGGLPDPPSALRTEPDARSSHGATGS